MITSVVTLAEFGIMPTRRDRSDLIVQFENFLENLNIEILQVRKKDARKAPGATTHPGYPGYPVSPPKES